MEEEVDIRQQVLQSALEEIKTTSGNTESQADPCVICLDAISEKAVASPCRHHNFCFLCLVSWLQERSTCPLCKSEVCSVEYDWQAPEDFKVYKVPSTDNQTPRNDPSHPSYTISTGYRGRRPRTRRLHGGSRPRPAPTLDAALLRRKQIYQTQLYSLHVGSNRVSRFRDLTPQIFCRDNELISRARKWIRRELQVFEFLNLESDVEKGTTRRANNAEFLLEYIVAILKSVDVKGSGGQAEDMLQEFLGRDNTRLFLHELKAWLRSPYISLEDWDRNVQYNERTQEGRCQESVYNNYARKSPERESKVSNPSNMVVRKGNRRRVDRYIPYQTNTP